MDFTIQTHDTALYPLLHFVLDDLPTSTKSPELDDVNTRYAVKESQVVCTPMTEVVPMYLKYLVDVGFLPAPDGHGETLPDLGIAVTRMVSRSQRG